MAYFLFIDESGNDRKFSPYEVLAGISVQDSRVWELITEIQQAEIEYFGQRISKDYLELKAKKLLKKKTFKHAKEIDPISLDERTSIVHKFLLEGQLAKKEGRNCKVTKRQLAALGQAKIAFCKKVFEICVKKEVKTFASIVDNKAHRTEENFLRKDYSYLFERFYYFLEDQRNDNQGIVVFDELERSKCNILIEQMSRYFKDTAKGRSRASLIIPEPFFVHSELTTLIQVSDLLAYIIVWGVRIGKKMTHEKRDELQDLAKAVCDMQYNTYKYCGKGNNKEYNLRSFAIINDLRPRKERVK